MALVTVVGFAPSAKTNGNLPDALAHQQGNQAEKYNHRREKQADRQIATAEQP